MTRNQVSNVPRGLTLGVAYERGGDKNMAMAIAMTIAMAIAMAIVEVRK
jgi:hypothetical protein